MDSNILLEDHVNRLAYQCGEILMGINQLHERLEYVENVLSKLLIALVEGGVIVPDDNGNHQF